MLTKTLGGNRLGSGGKMQVHMKNFNRSTHDKGYLWRSSASFGTLIPFMVQLAKPQDTWDIELNAEILTHPTVGPVFGSAKVQLDVFLAPIRLYNSWLHNNKLGIGRDMSEVKLPQIELLAQEVEALPGDIDNTQVNPSCILAYLGIRGIGMTGTPVERTFNATSFLVYWDIYKNYYANKQEEIGAVIHTALPAPGGDVDALEASGIVVDVAPGITNAPIGTNSLITVAYTVTPPNPQTIVLNTITNGKKTMSELCTIINDDGAGLITGTYNAAYFGADIVINYSRLSLTDIRTVEPSVTTFPLENLDAMREAILEVPGNVPFIVNSPDIIPYTYIANSGEAGTANRMASQEGLAVKTYQSDLLNNWLNTDWIEDINTRSAVSTAGGSFSMDQLLVAEKVFDFLNRIAASDGTYYSWIEAAYAPPGHRHAETPMYMGGLTKELVFQEVISNSASTDTEVEQPLGTLGGRGKLGSKHKGGRVHIKVEEPSYIMGLVSVTPRIDNSQGNAWDIYLENMDQIHKPSMDQIGFQDLLTRQMAWWDDTYTGGNWTSKSAGKQPAWINYQTEISKTYGNFAIRNNEMFMTFNRRYEYNGSTIQDVTTYIDPAKFNFIFAQTSLDAQNLWINIAVDATVRQLMSANIMPAL